MQKKEINIELRLSNLLEKIVESPRTHACWINTLAFLEHIGSRKIMKSQNSNYLDLEVLKHLSEETRHAFFLKNICERHFPGICPSFEACYLLGGESGNKYFQELDSYVDSKLNQGKLKPYLNYHYVTLAIEERALSVYEVYAKVLKGIGSSIKINSLLAEEKGHLKETLEVLEKTDLDFEYNSNQFFTKETILFENFLKEIEKEVYSFAEASIEKGAVL